MTAFWHDWHSGLRRMWKRPGFTTVVVLTLALGIGGNTAIFSVVNAVLFHSLPFANAQRLVRLYDVRRRDDGQVSQVSVSPRNFHEVREQARSFESVAAQIFLNVNLRLGEGSERVVGIGVSEGWLSTLGVKPILGRAFNNDEETAGSESSAVLISHGFWERRLGGDQSVLGKSLTLNERVYTVVGILPRGFDYPYHSEVWLPWTFDRGNGRVHPLNVQARLKSDVTPEQAQAELSTIAQRLSESYPETNAGYQFAVVPLRDVLVEGGGRVVMILLAGVGFLLLVVCANVANLLLTQAIGRQREFAIRGALGASRFRQLRQLFAENVTLALAGGGAGFLATLWLRGSLIQLFPSDLTYVIQEVPINLTVMGFGLLVSIVVGVLLALVPALRATRTDLVTLIKSGSRSNSSTGDRVLDYLVVGELAIALVLLAGAGLMIQNFYRLQNASLGLSTENLLTLKISLPESAYDEPAKRSGLLNQLLEQVQAQPGITNATVANLVPLTNGNVTASIVPEGRVFDPNEHLVVSYRVVSPRYFEALKLPLLKGRTFSQQDTANSEPVAIISQSAARHYWSGEDPVGRRVRRQRAGGESPWMRVVGIATDVREPTPSRKDLQETLYIPFEQDTTTDRTWATSSIQLAVRASVDPLSAISALKRTIWQVDKRLSVFDVSTAEQLYSEALAQNRIGTVMLLSFSGFGLLLAAIGTYGVFSYKVTSRTRELGIRMALGAKRSDVLQLVMRQGALLALAGVGLGLAGALVLTRFMSGVLTEIRPSDPVTFAIVCIFLVAIALLACYIPARRATEVDPLVALRYE